jgi:DNA modification methylase
MEPYWTDGERTIYHGDCREIMPELPGGAFDLVCADPPYGLSKAGTDWSPRQGPKSKILRPINKVSWDVASFEWLGLLPRLLAPTGTAISFCKVQDIGVLRDGLAAAGLTPRGEIFWLKTNPIPRGAGKVYASAMEAIVWAARDGYHWSPPAHANERHNVIVAPHETNPVEVSHPSQKPRAVMRVLLRTHCPAGGAVLDPFMGSGTTGVVCRELGLRFVGIERQDTPEEPYCTISARRMEKVPTGQLALFGDNGEARKGARGPRNAVLLTPGS